MFVFEKGAHRERFDEFGNGRGLAGREYLYAHDGMTESPSRNHEVYSSVVRRRKSLEVWTLHGKYGIAFRFQK